MNLSDLRPAPPASRDGIEARFRASPDAPVEWRVSDGLVPYEEALAVMEERVAAISEGHAPECVWLLEHPPLYTAGSSADDGGLFDAGGLPVFRSGRGGQYTYHGPGQRVAYVMLDLKRRRPDLRAYVAALESWLIAALASFNIRGERREDRVGVWVRRPELGAGREDKIAAIGVRVRRWTTFHGVSLNIDPDLSRFDGIAPCGIVDPRYGVTSLVDLGLPAATPDVDLALREAFAPIFGPVA